MNDWYSGIYKALLLTSIISFVIYNFSSGQTSLGALLSGLVALTLSLFMILYIILYNTIDLIKNLSFFQNYFVYSN